MKHKTHIVIYLIFIDFGRTSSIFSATALKVQNLLAEITPPTNGIPDQSTSVPLLFYNWLHDLVSGYPNGCV